MKTSFFPGNATNCVILAMLPLYIFIHARLLPKELSVNGIEDAGFVSFVTLTFIASSILALVILLVNTKERQCKLRILAILYVNLIYFLREADLHRLLTDEHVTRLKFYTMESIPVWQKLFASIILLIFLFCLLFLIARYIRLFASNIKLFTPWSVAIIIWLSLLIISQLCDKSRLNAIHTGRIIEECSECWASIFMYIAILQFLTKQYMLDEHRVTAFYK